MVNYINFLKSTANYNFDNENINNSIQNCEFKNLYSQEDLYGFDGETRDEIESLFKDEMVDIGYL